MRMQPPNRAMAPPLIEQIDMAFSGSPRARVVRRALAAATFVVPSGARLAWHYRVAAALAAQVVAQVLMLVAEEWVAASTLQR